MKGRKSSLSSSGSSMLSQSSLVIWWSEEFHCLFFPVVEGRIDDVARGWFCRNRQRRVEEKRVGQGKASSITQNVNVAGCSCVSGPAFCLEKHFLTLHRQDKKKQKYKLKQRSNEPLKLRRTRGNMESNMNKWKGWICSFNMEKPARAWVLCSR